MILHGDQMMTRVKLAAIGDMRPVCAQDAPAKCITVMQHTRARTASELSRVAETLL